MRTELQELWSAPLAPNTSAELFNATTSNESDKEDAKSKFCFPVGSGCNSKEAECPHNVFVLDVDGNPLTPTTSSKARKLMKGKQAKPVWNKFSQFGIQMSVRTRTETPLVVLGQDWGTKFEGYSLISGRENNLNVMLKLPDKKKLVKKLEKRKQLRRARRQRNCRRRECRFNNRSKKDFIAPSQLQIVNSRIKCMNEFFRCYPVQKVVVEDVKFNHRDKRWGKNFTTVEVGKKKIFDFIRAKVGAGNLIMFSGMDTQEFREKLNLKKVKDKSSKNFYAHCVDSFVIANELSQAVPNESIIFIDDSYRPVRRRLHDSQFSKGHIRYPYSKGNFKGIRKGTMCEFGQIVGGTKSYVYYQDFEIRNGKKIGQKEKSIKKIYWLSHCYKYRKVMTVYSSSNLRGIFAIGG